LLCLNLSAASGGAEALDINVGSTLPRIENLKEGSKTYIRYRIRTDGVSEPIDLQVKTLKVEERAGTKELRISQHWQTATAALRLESLFEPKTLKPLTHERIREREGKITKEGFRFLGKRVISLETMPDNSRAGFEIAGAVTPFNFEIDLETLQSMPLEKGAEFRIPFYHPGGPAPAHYTFKVVAEEVLRLGGASIPCWVVSTDYNAPEKPLAKFWIEKGSQTVVRVVQPLDDGTTIVKALVV
jgi:hypothetical protein